MPAPQRPPAEEIREDEIGVSDTFGPPDPWQVHGIHPEDGSDEFTATTDRASLSLQTAYLHANTYLRGPTPEQHWASVRERAERRGARRTRGADRLPQFRPASGEVTLAAAAAAREAFAAHLRGQPEEQLEQT